MNYKVTLNNNTLYEGDNKNLAKGIYRSTKKRCKHTLHNYDLLLRAGGAIIKGLCDDKPKL